MGRPVVAYGDGGALDTVVPGVTGELFAAQTPASLAAALAGFDPRRYDPAACRQQAERFSTQSFRANLLAYLAQVWAEQSGEVARKAAKNAQAGAAP